jgi:hypothetical protein
MVCVHQRGPLRLPPPQALLVILPPHGVATWSLWWAKHSTLITLLVALTANTTVRDAWWVKCKHEDARMGGWMDALNYYFSKRLYEQIWHDCSGPVVFPPSFADSPAFYCRYAGRCLLSFLGFLRPSKQVLRKWQAANCDSINRPIDTTGAVI